MLRDLRFILEALPASSVDGVADDLCNHLLAQHCVGELLEER
jgi:hypothetical protein